MMRMLKAPLFLALSVLSICLLAVEVVGMSRGRGSLVLAVLWLVCAAVNLTNLVGTIRGK